MKKRFGFEDCALLALGGLAYAFVGWRWNMALACLAAPPLLMRFSRRRERWYGVFSLMPFLALGTFLAFYKAWDLDPWMIVMISCLRPLLVIVPLLLDRGLRRRLPPFAPSLVFPASMVAIEYAMSFSPFATVLSGVVGLYGLRELSQLSSLFGIWGLGFLAYWLAPAANAFVEADFRLKPAGAAALVPLVTLGAALAFGAIRIGSAPIGAPTVRVAGISVEHPRDYWNLIDEKTPRDKALALVSETAAIEEKLFETSSRAAAEGAKIVFWSEGDCVLNEDEEAAFTARACAFAKEKDIYLGAAVLVLHYGSGLSDNKVLLCTPEGRLASTYVKTISWYPTGSDGKLKVVDTPYGRLGAAICYDMDTPAFARGLSRLGADIVIVPAFDTERIRPFHTEVGLFRAVENGYSVFRQVAAGTSMAVDGRGIVRGMQDYFAGPDRLCIADLPMKAERTLYGVIGDLFAWLDLALILGLIAASLFGAAARGKEKA